MASGSNASSSNHHHPYDHHTHNLNIIRNFSNSRLNRSDSGADTASDAVSDAVSVCDDEALKDEIIAALILVSAGRQRRELEERSVQGTPSGALPTRRG